LNQEKQLLSRKAETCFAPAGSGNSGLEAVKNSDPASYETFYPNRTGIMISQTNGFACDHWDRQMEVWQRCQARARRVRFTDWESEEGALRYWEQTWNFQKERIAFFLARLMPLEGARVLDIGCGPGVLSIPMSLAGARVTALDRSEAMLEVLKSMAKKNGADKISTLHLSWEEMEPAVHLAGEPPFDLVVSSLSLIMLGVKDCLLKMRQVCRGEIHLLWPRSKNFWSQQLTRLYPALYGFDYCPKPGAEVLVQAVEEIINQSNGNGSLDETATKPRLGQVGKAAKSGKTTEAVHPVPDSTYIQDTNSRLSAGQSDELSVEDVVLTYREAFSSREEARRHFKSYFGLSEGQQFSVLEGFLEESLRTDGQQLILEHPLPLVHITWKCAIKGS